MPRKLIDLTGHKYGRLTVLREAERRGYTRRWECVCDCGKSLPIVVDMPSLRTGHTTSCGCYQSERASERNGKNLVNRKFGKLTVLERAGTYANKITWRCRCDCGNETVVVSTHLLGGITKSCGCARKDGAARARRALLRHHTIKMVSIPLLRRGVRSDSVSRVKGVNKRIAPNGRVSYVAYITAKGEDIYLGTYPTRKKAEMARRRGEEKYHAPLMTKGRFPLTTRKCDRCGVMFTGHGRQSHCKLCRPFMGQESVQKHQANARKGIARQVGAIYHCNSCGEPYKLRGPNQKTCQKCQKQKKEGKMNV